MPAKKKSPFVQAAAAAKKSRVEDEVADDVKRFMLAHGWRRFRMTSGLFTTPAGYPCRIGEPGIPDQLWIRYVRDKQGQPSGVAYVLWIETKRAVGGKRRESQIDWHRDEGILGALIYVAKDVGELRDWYYERFGFLHKTENLFLQAGLR